MQLKADVFMQFLQTELFRTPTLRFLRGLLQAGLNNVLATKLYCLP